MYGGSATLTLFKPGRMRWDADLRDNSYKLWETKVKVGQSIGRATAVRCEGATSMMRLRCELLCSSPKSCRVGLGTVCGEGVISDISMLLVLSIPGSVTTNPDAPLKLLSS
jgi:hypothetical protein